MLHKNNQSILLQRKENAEKYANTKSTIARSRYKYELYCTGKLYCTK